MRTWLILVGVAAVVVVVVFLICFLLGPCRRGCKPGTVCLLCENITLDRVKRVELDPAEVFTEAGNSFRIAAVPVGGNGLPIRVRDPSKDTIPVEWAPARYLTPLGDSAKVEIPADEPPQTVSPILATVHGKGPPEPGRVRIGPSEAGGGIALRIPHAPGSPPDAVLLEWEEQAGAGNSGFRGLAMAGTAWLHETVAEASSAQALVFAAGSGMRLTDFSSGSPQTSATAPPAAPPERSVLVHVRLNLAAPKDEVGFAAAVAKARALADRHFRANRTGIRLDWEEWPADSLQPLTGDFSSCDDVTLKERLGVQVTDEEAADGEALDAHEVWVVFVPRTSGKSGGHMCDRTRRRGPVIVMSAKHFNPTTLAHELGHVFGMASELQNVGHTESRPGFTPANLMWGAPDVCTGRTRERFSLGQIFRMNLDTGSWVWHQTRAGAGGWPACMKRKCQPGFGEGECPALATDYPRGGGS